MNINQKKVMVALMEMAAVSFSNHGCNDFYLKDLIPDVEERRKMVREFHAFNGDPSEFLEGGTYEMFSDYALMDFFAAKLKLEIEGEELDNEVRNKA